MIGASAAIYPTHSPGITPRNQTDSLDKTSVFNAISFKQINPSSITDSHSHYIPATLPTLFISATGDSYDNEIPLPEKKSFFHKNFALNSLIEQLNTYRLIDLITGTVNYCAETQLPEHYTLEKNVELKDLTCPVTLDLLKEPRLIPDKANSNVTMSLDSFNQLPLPKRNPMNRALFENTTLPNNAIKNVITQLQMEGLFSENNTLTIASAPGKKGYIVHPTRIVQGSPSPVLLHDNSHLEISVKPQKTMKDYYLMRQESAAHCKAEEAEKIKNPQSAKDWKLVIRHIKASNPAEIIHLVSYSTQSKTVTLLDAYEHYCIALRDPTIKYQFPEIKTLMERGNRESIKLPDLDNLDQLKLYPLSELQELFPSETTPVAPSPRPHFIATLLGCLCQDA